MKDAAQTGWCTKTKITAEPVSSPAFPRGSCKSFRTARFGHANEVVGCTNLLELARVCVGDQPSCSDFSIDYGGCRTFYNLSTAREYMEKLKKLLGGNQTVSVSANQCIANSDGTCQTRYNFIVSSTFVQEPKPGPCIIGESCSGDDHKKTSTCGTANGRKTQTCCCTKFTQDGYGLNCTFVDGRSC
jgi:hypothetical protein